MEFYPGRRTRQDGKIVGGYNPIEHLSKEQEEFQKAYIKHIKKNMHFKNDIIEKAHARLLEVANSRKLDTKKAIFIGVHVRKTDHADFVKRQLNLEPIYDEYYNDGMDYFRDNYDNCVFIVASDDIEWCKKHIDTSKEDVVFSESNPTFYRDKDGNLSDEDDSKAAYDLVLLSSCNHTVVSRGTFSFWVAMLAGGEYFTENGIIVPPQHYGQS